MQTLGLSDSTLRTEGRLKSLFWPSIQTGSDVDYLGAQGYWVCTVVAILSFVGSLASGRAITGVLALTLFYFGGVGVRERSRYAAAVVLVLFIDRLVAAPGIVGTLLGALLLSNFRATWIASRWEPQSEDAILPARLGETWSDNFADRLPQWLWPKVRVPYYILSAGMLVFAAVGLVIIILHSN